MSKKIIVAVLCVMFLSACSSFGKTSVLTREDPYCRAIKEVPYVPAQNDLNIEQYLGIEVQGVDVENKRFVQLSVEDFGKILKVLVESENYILNERIERENMVEYYDPSRFDQED